MLSEEKQAFARGAHLHTSISQGDCVAFEFDGGFELWTSLISGWKLVKSGRGSLVL
jgi:hypothetical protein